MLGIEKLGQHPQIVNLIGDVGVPEPCHCLHQCLGKKAGLAQFGWMLLLRRRDR